MRRDRALDVTIMMRQLISCRVLALSLAGGCQPWFGAAAACGAAEGSSCRIDQLPPAEQLPAAPLLVAAYAFVWLAVFCLSVVDLARLGKVEAEMRALQQRPSRQSDAVTAGHFIFIPAVLLVGIVIGWILGSRAARGCVCGGAEATGAKEVRR